MSSRKYFENHANQNQEFIQVFLSDPNRGISDFRDVLSSAYNNVKQNKVEELLQNLIDANNKQLVTNADVAKIIFNWQISITENDKQPVMTTQDKVKVIANQIRRATKNRNLRGDYLFDIGGDTGDLTKAVARELGMKPVVVDVDFGYDWGNTASTSSEQDELIKIIYNGVDLAEAMNQVLQGKQASVVMYNHVLHHIPMQENNLQQAVSKLQNGGALLVQEHAHVMDQNKLDLVHVMLHMKNNINKENIRSENEAAVEMDKLIDGFGQTRYLSTTRLSDNFDKLGLNVVTAQSKENSGPQHTYYVVATKSPELTRTRRLSTNENPIASNMKCSNSDHKPSNELYAGKLDFQALNGALYDTQFNPELTYQNDKPKEQPISHASKQEADRNLNAPQLIK